MISARRSQTCQRQGAADLKAAASAADPSLRNVLELGSVLGRFESVWVRFGNVLEMFGSVRERLGSVWERFLSERVGTFWERSRDV